LDSAREGIDAGLTTELKPKTGYVDLHAEAVGTILRNDAVGRIGVEAGYSIARNLTLYGAANALTDRTWNAGVGLRWRF
jgi:hypothetical protein